MMFLIRTENTYYPVPVAEKPLQKSSKMSLLKPRPKHHPINQNQQKLKPGHVSTTPSLSRSTRNSDLVFPALAELPEGHPSRDYPSHELEQQTISGSDRDAFQSENGSRTVTRFEEYRENIKRVVEIILHTSWSNKSFLGRIEMLFKLKTGQER